MAQIVLILGESGTGKSASLRNFQNGEIALVNIGKKPLPFRGNFNTINSCDFDEISKFVQSVPEKIIVVDDAFFLSHIETKDDGRQKIKTIGKMLDEKITIEGMFTVVLKTYVSDGKYYFVTQNSGMDTVKSPIGMFPSITIDNDLKYVAEKIKNYYYMDGAKTDAEMQAADEAVKTEVNPSEKKSRRRRKAEETAVEDEPIADVKAEQPADAPAVKEEPKQEETPKRRRRKSRAESMHSLEITDEEIPF